MCKTGVRWIDGWTDRQTDRWTDREWCVRLYYIYIRKIVSDHKERKSAMCLSTGLWRSPLFLLWNVGKCSAWLIKKDALLQSSSWKNIATQTCDQLRNVYRWTLKYRIACLPESWILLTFLSSVVSTTPHRFNSFSITNHDKIVYMFLQPLFCPVPSFPALSLSTQTFSNCSGWFGAEWMKCQQGGTNHISFKTLLRNKDIIRHNV